MNNNEYYILSYDDERAFNDYDSAYEYDLHHNPELHPYDDASMERAEEVIYSVSWDELNEAQQQSLNPWRE